VCGCTPVSMATACMGKNCGTISDGCSGHYTCGTCSPPETCAGGTPSTPNICGCTPLTERQACAAGQNCGTAPNGCGGNVGCGSCASPQTCGGGGTAGQCGCTPSCPMCGIADGCGQTCGCAGLGVCIAGICCIGPLCL
jgi:hypothetical protein